MPLLTSFFLGWVGLGLVEFVGFILIVRLTCFPTQQNLVNHKHRDVENAPAVVVPIQSRKVTRVINRENPYQGNSRRVETKHVTG